MENSGLFIDMNQLGLKQDDQSKVSDCQVDFPRESVIPFFGLKSCVNLESDIQTSANILEILLRFS